MYHTPRLQLLLSQKSHTLVTIDSLLGNLCFIQIVHKWKIVGKFIIKLFDRNEFSSIFGGSVSLFQLRSTLISTRVVVNRIQQNNTKIRMGRNFLIDLKFAIKTSIR